MTAITISSSINLSQSDIAGNQFSISGSSSSSQPIVISLTEDLVLTSSASLFSGSNLGHWILNGNGHSITVDGVINFEGIFTTINAGGVVENLEVIALNGSSLASNMGSIAQISDGLITRVHTNFPTSNYGGAIVGTMNVNGVVSYSYSTGEIAGVYSGGIVGMSSFGAIHDSYSTGNISGMYAGGIAGIENSGPISNAFSTGQISNYFSGGIVSLFNIGSVTNVYTIGSMSNLGYQGGISYSNGDPIVGGYALSYAYTTGSTGTGFHNNSITSINPPFGYISSDAIDGSVTNAMGTDGGPWSDAQAQLYLLGVGTIWLDPLGVSSPYQLASNPGAYSGSGDIGANNPWVGNLLSIVITDDTFNNGNYFFADQAEQFGFGGVYGAPSQNLFVASYQWYLNNIAISGANSSTLTMVGAYLGQEVTAHVTYTNGNGVTSTVVKSPVAKINGVFDTAENVSTYLDAIENNHALIINALGLTGGFQILDGANTATQFTVSQLVNNVDVLTLILDNNYLVGLTDTSSNILSNLNQVIANAPVLSSIAMMDTASVSITGVQAAALASAFVGSDFHGYQKAEMLFNVNPSGTLYIKNNGGALSTVNAGASVLFADEFISIAGLIANSSSLVPLFQSSGGIGGFTLPELFTGPASLGLKYQLIETADNAVVYGSQYNDFIKVSSANSLGKAVNGGGGNDVIDGGVGSTFVTGGGSGANSSTYFLDGRAPGTSWSTITDFKLDIDKATIWGFVKGVSSVDASFANFNGAGAAGYEGLTLHFKNLLPSGQTSGSNPNLNSITLTGRTLQEFGASSLTELNNQINAGTNPNFLVGATQDNLGTHGYLFIN